jgi:hypothetical protein
MRLVHVLAQRLRRDGQRERALEAHEPVVATSSLAAMAPRQPYRQGLS